MGYEHAIPWSDDDLATLRRMHSDGIPFWEIGLAVGRSKNAAISKARYLGLPERSSRKPPNTRPPLTPAQQAAKARHAAVSANTLKRFECEEADGAALVGIFDLKATHCRWPVRGDRVDTLFCGQPKEEGSYCLAHAKRAWGRAPA